MRILKIGACALACTLAACSTVKPKGPKLYESATLVVLSEDVLLMPQNIDKDFLRVVKQRLEQYTINELGGQGDLQLVSSCGPRTMRITQEFTSISLGDTTYVTGGMNPFKASASAKKSNDIRFNVNLILQDCETGRTIYSHEYPGTGEDPLEILKWFASWNAGYAYQHQHSAAASSQPAR